MLSVELRRCLTAGRGWSRYSITADTSVVEVSSTISGSCRPLTALGVGQSESSVLVIDLRSIPVLCRSVLVSFHTVNYFTYF